MQNIEKYLEIWQENNFNTQIIELTYADFAAKKQGESFKFMLQQLGSVPTSTNPLNDELILSLMEFIEKQPFVNESLKKAILLIVENCFASFFDMKGKGKGKTIWQNVLIILSGTYRKDVKNIVNIVNFKPQTRPNEAAPKARVSEVVKQIEVETAQTVELFDEPECDTCGKTISKSDLPIGKGEVKRAYKRRNK